MRIADAVLLAILKETDPITRQSLQRSARDLLELLARKVALQFRQVGDQAIRDEVPLMSSQAARAVTAAAG